MFTSLSCSASVSIKCHFFENENETEMNFQSPTRSLDAAIDRFYSVGCLWMWIEMILGCLTIFVPIRGSKHECQDSSFELYQWLFASGLFHMVAPPLLLDLARGCGFLVWGTVLFCLCSIAQVIGAIAVYVNRECVADITTIGVWSIIILVLQSVPMSVIYSTILMVHFAMQKEEPTRLVEATSSSQTETEPESASPSGLREAPAGKTPC